MLGSCRAGEAQCVVGLGLRYCELMLLPPAPPALAAMDAVVDRLGAALRALPPVPSAADQAAIVTAATSGTDGGVRDHLADLYPSLRSLVLQEAAVAALALCLRGEAQTARRLGEGAEGEGWPASTLSTPSLPSPCRRSPKAAPVPVGPRGGDRHRHCQWRRLSHGLSALA